MQKNEWKNKLAHYFGCGRDEWKNSLAHYFGCGRDRFLHTCMWGGALNVGTPTAIRWSLDCILDEVNIAIH